jgi:hypothetical protein
MPHPIYGDRRFSAAYSNYSSCSNSEWIRLQILIRFFPENTYIKPLYAVPHKACTQSRLILTPPSPHGPHQDNLALDISQRSSTSFNTEKPRLLMQGELRFLSSRPINATCT